MDNSQSKRYWVFTYVENPSFERKRFESIYDVGFSIKNETWSFAKPQDDGDRPHIQARSGGEPIGTDTAVGGFGCEAAGVEPKTVE
jgi:hypothetical protein